MEVERSFMISDWTVFNLKLDFAHLTSQKIKFKIFRAQFSAFFHNNYIASSKKSFKYTKNPTKYL